MKTYRVCNYFQMRWRLLELLVISKQSLTINSTELLQRFIFDLANPLTADLKLLADFGKRVLMTVAKSESQLEHEFFARRQAIERLVHVTLEHRLAGGIVGSFGNLVGDQITKTCFIFAADRCLERNGALGSLNDLLDFLRLNGHRFGDFFGSWLAAKLLGEHVERLAIARD